MKIQKLAIVYWQLSNVQAEYEAKAAQKLCVYHAWIVHHDLGSLISKGEWFHAKCAWLSNLLLLYFLRGNWNQLMQNSDPPIIFWYYCQDSYNNSKHSAPIFWMICKNKCLKKTEEKTQNSNAGFSLSSQPVESWMGVLPAKIRN